MYVRVLKTYAEDKGDYFYRKAENMKTMAEMSNSELFNVLTGGCGVMAQFHLQQIIMDYRHRNKTDSAQRMDLSSIVQEYLRSQD